FLIGQGALQGRVRLRDDVLLAASRLPPRLRQAKRGDLEPCTGLVEVFRERIRVGLQQDLTFLDCLAGLNRHRLDAPGHTEAQCELLLSDNAAAEWQELSDVAATNDHGLPARRRGPVRPELGTLELAGRSRARARLSAEIVVSGRLDADHRCEPSAAGRRQHQESYCGHYPPALTPAHPCLPPPAACTDPREVRPRVAIPTVAEPIVSGAC